MRYAVFWTEAARNDLREIYDHLLTVASRETDKRLVRDIRHSTQLLPEHPRLYQVFEGSIQQARHIVIYRWRVLYIVDDDATSCTVVTVVDARQNI